MRFLAAFVCGALLGFVAAPRSEPPAVATPAARPDGLTARQRQILTLVGEGLTTKEIAARERISHASVRTHVQRACERLGVHNRAAAIAALRDRLGT